MARGKGGGKRGGWGGRGRGGKGKGKKRKRHARDIGDEDDEEPTKGNGKGKAHRKGKDSEASKRVTEDPTDEAEPPPIRKSVRPGYDKLLQAFGVGGGDSGTTSDSDSGDEDAEGEESGEEDFDDADGGTLEPESEQLTRNTQAEDDAKEEEEEEQDDGEEDEQVEEDDEDANNVNAAASESHEGSKHLDFYPHFWDDPPQLLPPERAKPTATTAAARGAFAVPGFSRCEARKCDVATLLPYLRSASEAAGVWKRCGLAPGLQRKFEQFLSKDGFEVTPCIGSLFLFLHAYLDVSFPQHTHLNSRAVRAVCMLHAVDHVLKVSDEVFTNTEAVRNDSGTSSGTKGKGAKAAAAANEEHPLADQGFTRARILVLCPFRSACYEMVKMFLACCPNAKLVVNKKRFEDEFGAEAEEDGEANRKKPADYRHLFSGNTDDRFHVGLAVRRKSVRLYSPFKNSDVLFCSPLGLRQITGAEGEKNRDYDFLSSIEVCIVDRADVLRMQNWEHLEEVLQVVNRRPQSIEGIDISRLRPAFAAGNARAFRQTVVTSAGQSMDASSLFTKSSSSSSAPDKASSSLARKLCFGGGSDNEDEGDTDACFRTGLMAKVDACPSQSCRGLVCLVGPPEGAPLQHTRALGVARQFFLHAPCGPLAEQADQLFKVFENRYWKPLGASLEHLLIVATTYFSFLRLRQYFREESASFCSVYEYSKSGDLGKARTKFVQGERRVLLVTERFLWYRRYHLKGVDYVLFYGPPETPEIYEDVLNAVRTPSECNSMCLFTRHDAFALERIVGHERAVRMLAAPPGKVFVYS